MAGRLTLDVQNRKAGTADSPKPQRPARPVRAALTRPLGDRSGLTSGAERLAATAGIGAAPGTAPKPASGGLGSRIKAGAKTVVRAFADGARQIGGKLTRESGTLASRRIERDPADANSKSPKARKKAEKYLKQHEAKIARRRDRLSEADRARFDRIRGAAEGDPVGQAALAKLLLGGKLPGRKARGGDHDSLLAQLDKLATQPIADGIDRRDLVADTIEEISDPSVIAQHAKGTCVATVGTILLARTDAAEYVRLVAGLATPGGKVKTVRGNTLIREPDWQAPDGGRTVSGRLLQPALMEFGNGKRKYDNSRDQHSNGKSGLSAKESERILESLTGKDYKTIDVSKKKIAQKKLDAAFDKVKSALARGQRVPCSLLWTQKGHEILVSKVAKDRVYYINPWGIEESMSVSEFKSRLTSVNLLAA